MSKKQVIGILAHVDAGKTTLAEGLLYACKVIRKLGRVDNQDTFLDTNALERARGITIFSKQAVLESEERDLYVTLLDTPGHVDFSGETERTLQVLDACILLINGADGVDAHTAALWQLLAAHHIPVYLFVNKMDQFELKGSEEGDLISCQAFEDRKQMILREMSFVFGSEEGIVTDWAGVLAGSEEVLESAVGNDEAAMEEYLEQGELSKETLQRLFFERKLFPVLFGSALKQIGVRDVVDLLCYMGAEHNLALGGGQDRETVNGGEAFDNHQVEQFGARIFKITRDADGNRLTHMRIVSGSLQNRSVLSDGEKVNQIRIYSGEKFKTVNEVTVGDVCAVLGLSNTFAGQGLGTCALADQLLLEERKKGKLPGEQIAKSEPVLVYRVIPPEGMDAKSQLLPVLNILQEEEPLLDVNWDPESSQILLHVMGEVQLEVLQSMAKSRFGLDITFGEGRIIYRESIRTTVEGVGHFEPLRHYAEVHVLMEPLPAGSGLVFDTDCREEMLERHWQRLILTHLQERKIRGVLTRSELTDVKITVVGGRAHPKHTEGGDFRQATYRALRQGLMQAESVLLEPYFKFKLELPTESVGRAMADISMMNGNVEPPKLGALPGQSVLEGTAPAACIRNYAKDVAAYTKGGGRLATSFSGYGPCHNAQEVIDSIGYDPLLDPAYTPDSVFCANGTSVIVPWNEVTSRMHVESYYSDHFSASEDEKLEEAARLVAEAAKNEQERRGKESASAEVWIGTDEIDAILARTFYSNSMSDGRDSKRSAKENGALRKRWATLNVANAAAEGAKVRRYGMEQNPATKTNMDNRRESILLVDGYNVIFSWNELNQLAKDNIDSARTLLLDLMCGYQSIEHRTKLIVVFDAYRVKGRQSIWEQYHNIDVVYTAEDETADRYIERFTHLNKNKAGITVVTSDHLEQITIRSQGSLLISSREFEQMVKRAGQTLMQQYDSDKEKTPKNTAIGDALQRMKMEADEH